ncbi:response regulator [Piscinibacter sakaiensis]|uniref:DNA-binding response regulator n=1 Tax=Piscinibacter sakaiensis TaxID=1547922 RepID=A0A0K8P3R0_PISS1|nr:response regulator [Piscinibacter sakaiensis]GAP37194.1 DNA-binding response regulator [Piscinibacter sakaiensis]
MTDTDPPPATPPHVLVVDDDPAVRDLLQDYLAGHEMRVTAVASGRAMLEAFEREAIDLVLLDLRLPGEDGLQLARTLRERARVPIVLLTGRTEEADRVMGLELGADDYVTKPFSPRELLARLRAVMRRYHVEQEALASTDKRAFRFEGYELNLRSRRLTAPDGRRIELGNHEFSLLAAFCTAPQRVLSRDQLLSMSRLHSAEVYDRTVDVQVLRLRRKIEADPFHPRLIVTERGAGYRFDARVEALV